MFNQITKKAIQHAVANPREIATDLVDAYNKSETTHKLVIVGDADHNDDYSRKIKSKASEKVIIAGRRGGSELQSLYKFARVFVCNVLITF